MKRLASIVVAAMTLLAAGVCPAGTVGLIRIESAIGPSTVSYISRAIEVSTARKDECLIIQLDTPGGLLSSTKEIVQEFYDSKVPTVVYVSPSTAVAGSAGTFITIAADIAAMAPHSSIGAAHPVSIGNTGNVEKTDDVMKKKMESYASSFIESIANKRSRNVEWARSAVIESASITAEKALDLNVIDLIADDMPDLLKQIDGFEVADKTLKTEGIQTIEIPMTPWEKFSLLFLRPEVMFVLVLVVIYGIIGELSTPGAILPGVAGAIALILFLYMSSVLPVNIAGLALIGLAVALFVADIFATTHGVLTLGGIVAFFLGSMMLFNNTGPGFTLSLSYIIPATLITAGFFAFVVGAGLRAQFKPSVTGIEALAGKPVQALSRVDSQGGKVMMDGEYWNAVSDVPLEKDQMAEVVGIDGLTLKVKPKT